MATDTMVIAAFAVPLSGNKGSASMVLGLMDGLETSGTPAELRLFSYYYKADTALARNMPRITVHRGHPKELAFGLIPHLVMRRLIPAWRGGAYAADIRALEESDVVALVGGTTFADSMLWKVPWNILAALPAYLLGKPAVFLSQTVGPFKKPLNRWAAKWTLRRAAQVCGRGDTSRDYARSIGIDASSWPDLSFPMLVPPVEQVLEAHPPLRAVLDEMQETGKPIVAFTPNSIVLGKAKGIGVDYIEFLAGAIEHVAELGYCPLLIPHSYRDTTDPKQQHNNDRWLCEQVHARTRDVAYYLDADLDSRELRAVIGACRFVVASRFHSMVSALSMGVPPLTYGWGGHKYREVLDQFQVPELCRDYRDLNAAGFAAGFDAMIADESSIRERLAASMPLVLKRNLELGAMLRAAADGKPATRSR